MEEGQLRIAIPIPLFYINKMLTLYEYLKVPVKLPDSKHYIAWSPERKYLAVNDEMTGYLMLEEQQLRDCQEFGNRFYSCQDTDFMLRDFGAYCLPAIYSQNKARVSKVCPAEIVAPRVIVQQISEGKFLLHHPYPISLETLCPKEGKRYPSLVFEGTRIHQLKQGCLATSLEYSLYSIPNSNLNVTTRLTEQIYYASDFLSQNFSFTALDLVYPEPPTFDQPLNEVLNKLIAHEGNMNWGNLSWLIPSSFGFSMISFIGSAITIVCVIICACYVCGAVKEKRRDYKHLVRMNRAQNEAFADLRNVQRAAAAQLVQQQPTAPPVPAPPPPPQVLYIAEPKAGATRFEPSLSGRGATVERGRRMSRSLNSFTTVAPMYAFPPPPPDL